ncbi:MAG: leucine-rich repeat protein [Rikenellaceae bacterium]
MGFYENISDENRDAFMEHLEERRKEGNALTDKQGAVYSPDFTKLLRLSKEYKEESYAVPIGIMSIGKNAFFMCENLSLIVIPNSVETIDNDAFKGCGDTLKYIVMPERFKEKPLYTPLYTIRLFF